VGYNKQLGEFLGPKVAGVAVNPQGTRSAQKPQPRIIDGAVFRMLVEKETMRGKTQPVKKELCEGFKNH